jgi:hypothetical protein
MSIYITLNDGKLIEGVDNYSLLVFSIIILYITYIFYSIYIEFNKRRNDLNRRLLNIENIPEGNNNNLENDNCAICSEVFNNPSQLDCNHKFCSKCIMEYYERTRPSLRCPLCRKNIRLINVLNFDRSQDNRKYIEMIAIFNHENLDGYNYVFFKNS